MRGSTHALLDDGAPQRPSGLQHDAANEVQHDQDVEHCGGGHTSSRAESGHCPGPPCPGAHAPMIAKDAAYVNHSRSTTEIMEAAYSVATVAHSDTSSRLFIET